MIEEIAEVIAVTPEGVRVRVERKSACGQCKVSASCGHGALQRFMLRREGEIEFDLLREKGVEVGEWVVIGITQRVLIYSAALAYLLPLAIIMMGLLLGAAVGAQLGTEGESPQIVGLFIGVLAAFLIAPRWTRRATRYAALTPVLIRRGESLSVEDKGCDQL